VVYDVDQRVRSEQFRWVADALRTAKLRTYVPAFKMVRQQLWLRPSMPCVRQAHGLDVIQPD
jgi:hypothetical protein